MKCVIIIAQNYPMYVKFLEINCFKMNFLDFPGLRLYKSTAVIVSLLATCLDFFMAKLLSSCLSTTVEVVINTGAHVTCS